MSYSTGQQQSLIYQADPAVIRHLHDVRDSLHKSCKPYLNHKIKVQTLDGQIHEGFMAGVDQRHLFLSVPAANPAHARGFYPYPGPGYPGPGYPGFGYPGPGYPGGGNVILPLVLFELLAISLI